MSVYGEVDRILEELKDNGYRIDNVICELRMIDRDDPMDYVMECIGEVISTLEEISDDIY